MNNHRSILSAFLLCIYALLLLHDYVPHAHSEHQRHSHPVQKTAHVHHDSDHEHYHGHSHHDEEEDQVPVKDGDIEPGGHIYGVNHSDSNLHQHDWVYRHSSKTNLAAHYLTFANVPDSFWNIPKPLDDHFDRSYRIEDVYINPLLLSGLSLRGPPHWV